MGGRINLRSNLDSGWRPIEKPVNRHARNCGGGGSLTTVYEDDFAAQSIATRGTPEGVRQDKSGQKGQSSNEEPVLRAVHGVSHFSLGSLEGERSP